MELSGARVLITGATGGIGEALAGAFANAGSDVVLSGRRERELTAVAEATKGKAIVADLALREDVARLLDEAGDVDVLVANAALPASGLLSDFTASQVDRALEVNLRAPIAMAHALAPLMVARGRGSLVFVSSLAGVAASKNSSLYNATKFGLRGFALALRQDLHGTGVGVSVVLPGFIRDAGMFADSGAKTPPGFGTRSPEDVAHAVLAAVRKDKGQVMVAPPVDRLGARIGGLAPGLGERLQRVAPDVTGQIAAGQVGKR
ncbi:MAG: Short-chain dehydrogenase/reductase [Frankiales bacterium]|nr:Short-chain dehydrogenase/reductase [Frankiales bacterium]